MNRIDAVIVNFGRRAEVLDVLRSLSQSSTPVEHVFVLNYGLPESVQDEQRAAYPGVHATTLSVNRGYAGNNNLGIHAALQSGADWVLVLNDDVELDARCIELLLAAGATDPRIGMIGPRLYHYDEPDVIQSDGGLFDASWRAAHAAQNERDYGTPMLPSDMAWLSGCVLLVRRALIEQTGMLDERFFLYWEEVEWCRRAIREGWRIVHEPAARAWHKGVQRNYRPRPEVSYYMTRNRLLLLSLHRAPLRAWITAWGETAHAQIGSLLHRRAPENRRMAWRGLCDFLRGRFGPLSQTPDAGLVRLSKEAS
jgi:GT2 family glycosyltransferase